MKSASGHRPVRAGSGRGARGGAGGLVQGPGRQCAQRRPDAGLKSAILARNARRSAAGMRPNTAISKAIAGFEGKRVLVAGDLMLDRYWSGEVDRISPEAPVPIVRRISSHAVPGGAANTACNVAALGARVILFGVAGQDEAGAELRAMLSRQGIDCAHIAIAAPRPTTVKLRILAHDQQIVRIDDEDTTTIDSGLAEQVVRDAPRASCRVWMPSLFRITPKVLPPREWSPESSMRRNVTANRWWSIPRAPTWSAIAALP